MLHYYIETGHKLGLDGIHRAMALIKHIDVDFALYVSDFSAVEFIKEVYGVRGVTGIDQVENLEKIALRYNDSLIFDSYINDRELLSSMQRFFTQVVRINYDQNDTTPFGKEILISPFCNDTEHSVNSIIIDDDLLSLNQCNNAKSIYFYNDYDSDKRLLKYRDKLKSLNSDFLLGHYFYYGYEKIFGDTFKNILDPYNYLNIFKNYETIITSNEYLALVSKIINKNVKFIPINNKVNASLMKKYAIDTLDLNTFEIKNIQNNFINNDYMDHKASKVWNYVKGFIN